MAEDEFIINPQERILITGAAGFVGSRVVESFLDRGFENLRCLVRPSSAISRVEALCERYSDRAKIEIFKGNLLSREDCVAMTRHVPVIVHLAAARGEKSFPDAYMNSVVTTRNLLDASLRHQCLRRFVNISSFAVYSNRNKPQARLLDEQCPVESHPHLQGGAYTFAKAKQDEIVAEYGAQFELPYVIVRPGYVYGPGNEAITGRIGIDTFGVFLHFGGFNKIPFTYVDNCADAIVLAALKKGIDGEVFNVVDDNVPSSRRFLRMYKKNVRPFTSFYVPHIGSYVFSYLWERYSNWSEGQLPPAFNRRRWHAFWKSTQYSNAKSKAKLGWEPRVPTEEGLARYFEACRRSGAHHA